MTESVLTAIFQHTSDFLTQEKHLAKGAFFLPVPEPPPEPLAELVLRVESPTNAVVELPVRVVQISQTHVALAFVHHDVARAALAPMFEEARAAQPVEGATWVHWGRAEPIEPAEIDDLTVPPMPSEDALLYDRIRAMSSPDKMQLALHGDRAARLLLIKDVNKTVQTFLLQNPRITIDEIRYLAGYRQANPDVLVAIAAHREWGQNPSVLGALLRNPKTPAMTAVKLVDRVAPGEQRRLAKSTEVSRAVQAAARKKVTE